VKGTQRKRRKQLPENGKGIITEQTFEEAKELS